VGITRELKEVSQAMGSMANQSNLVDFLVVPGNAQFVNGLVEDIHYAWMDYQVCAPKRPTLISSDICFRLHYNKTSMIRAVKRL